MAGIYVHIPFCEQKCIYCDFYSIVPSESKKERISLEKEFVSLLGREVDLLCDTLAHRDTIETIFIGGGTPSILSSSSIAAVLTLLSSRFTIASNHETTIEVNPGTVDKGKLEEYRQVGINRLSIGIQSFHDSDLQFLSRIHSFSDAVQCVRDARSSGYADISIDLIFSIPGQTLDAWKTNLEKALELQPTHLSCYSLIVEPDTPLHGMVNQGIVKPTSPEIEEEMYAHTIDFFGSNGYEQYEISNFAQRGYKCKHNVNYWNHTNYLGLGPSSHSLWNNTRWWNYSDLDQYRYSLEKGELPIEGREDLTKNQLIEEIVYLGLRSDGIDLRKVLNLYHYDLLTKQKSLIEELHRDSLIHLEDNILRLTPRGYALCDEIAARLLQE